MNWYDMSSEYFVCMWVSAVMCVYLQYIYSAPNRVHLLFGTNLCITSKLHHLRLKKVDRNIP